MAKAGSIVEKIEKLREELIERLKKVPEGQFIQLDYDQDVLECILFNDQKTGFPPIDMHGNKYCTCKKFALEKDLLRKIDFSNVSFDFFNATGFDFTGLHNVKINPQTVYNKDLTNTILNGVTFIGPFDGVSIFKTNFTGSQNAIINPKRLKRRIEDFIAGRTRIEKCIFSGVTFTGPMNNIISLKGCDFTNSTGAKIRINKQLHIARIVGEPTVDLSRCNFNDAEIIDNKLTIHDNFFIHGTNFSGQTRKKPLKIHIGRQVDDNLAGCNFEGVIITIDSKTRLVLKNTSFKGSRGAIIHLSNLNDPSELRTCDFRDARVFDNLGKELHVDKFGKLSSGLREKLNAALDSDYENQLRRAEGTIATQQKEIQRLKQEFQNQTSALLDLAERLERHQAQNAEKSLYASIPISRDILLKKVDNHFEFNTEMVDIEKLRFFNLSMIDFTNVKVSGIDFRDSKAQINPQKVYQKDISGCKFDDGNITPFIIMNGVTETETDYSACTYQPVMVKKHKMGE